MGGKSMNPYEAFESRSKSVAMGQLGGFRQSSSEDPQIPFNNSRSMQREQQHMEDDRALSQSHIDPRSRAKQTSFGLFTTHRQRQAKAAVGLK